MLNIYRETQPLRNVIWCTFLICVLWRWSCEVKLFINVLLVYVLLYLIVTLLGKEATLSDDQVEGNTGHQHTVTHVTKHHRKQEGEGNDGVWSCNRWDTRRDHHKTRLEQLKPLKYRVEISITDKANMLQSCKCFVRSETPPLMFWVSGKQQNFKLEEVEFTIFLHPVQARK